jgi:hypothetical protein
MAQSSREVGSCIIRIDGQTRAQVSDGQPKDPGSAGQLGLMELARVDTRLDAPAMFSFEFDIRPGSEVGLLDDLGEGKSVEILMGDVGKEEMVLKGEIHYIEPSFRFEGNSSVAVGGYDRSHRLTRGTSSRTWGDGIQSQDLHGTAVRDVIEGAQEIRGTRDALQASSIKSSGTRDTYVPQFNVSDWQFVKGLGHEGDRLVDANVIEDDRQIRFQDADVSRQPTRTLVRENPREDNDRVVHEARFTLSTIRQVARVEVRGWDPKNKAAIVGIAEAPTFDFGGQPGHQATGLALYGKSDAGKVLTIVDRPVDSQEEAEALAKSIFNHVSMDFLTGEVDLRGDPALRAGVIVEMKGFSRRFDGKYLVTECTHEMVPRTSGFTTRLKIARNDVGR